MKIPGPQMNLRWIVALVVSATALSFADSTSVAKGPGNKPAAGAKVFKKLDPATKEKWLKEKSRLDAKREEDKRKDRAEMEANLSELRQRSLQGNRTWTVAAKDGGAQKKGGKIPQQNPAPTDPLEAAQEKTLPLIQKQQAESQAQMAKDMERIKKVRQESERRRAKTPPKIEHSKADNKAGAPSKSDIKGGK